MNEATIHHLSPPARPTVVTRTLDVVDRGHARAAMKLHDVRNDLRATLEKGLDKVEQLVTGAVQRARDGLKVADARSADAVNRAQGLVGTAIERARHVREKRAA